MSAGMAAATGAPALSSSACAADGASPSIARVARRGRTRARRAESDGRGSVSIITSQYHMVLMHRHISTTSVSHQYQSRGTTQSSQCGGPMALRSPWDSGERRRLSVPRAREVQEARVRQRQHSTQPLGGRATRRPRAARRGAPAPRRAAGRRLPSARGALRSRRERRSTAPLSLPFPLARPLSPAPALTLSTPAPSAPPPACSPAGTRWSWAPPRRGRG